MKRLILLMCGVLCMFAVEAQERTVRAFEVEVGAGLSFGSAKFKEMLNLKNRVGETAFVEGRYNFRQIPIDLGLRFGGTMFSFDQLKTGETLQDKLKFKSGYVMGLADVNIFRKSNFSLFAGIGLGYALLGKGYDMSGIESADDTKSTFCYMPRVGLELWHHVRLTYSYIGGDEANRHSNLSLGIVFGGGRK